MRPESRGHVRIKSADPRQPPIYKPDPQIGVDFRSFEDFRRNVESSLKPLGPLDSPKRTESSGSTRKFVIEDSR